mmetsp:Transcript_16738/g.40331  ORF Transcript_16738/g.40331 Transcript_16738/m.40331 type:complete len:299 (-) Transcript_16738:7499-8395(-)
MQRLGDVAAHGRVEERRGDRFRHLVLVHEDVLGDRALHPHLELRFLGKVGRGDNQRPPDGYRVRKRHRCLEEDAEDDEEDDDEDDEERRREHREEEHIEQPPQHPPQKVVRHLEVVQSELEEGNPHVHEHNHVDHDRHHAEPPRLRQAGADVRAILAVLLGVDFPDAGPEEQREDNRDDREHLLHEDHEELCEDRLLRLSVADEVLEHEEEVALRAHCHHHLHRDRLIVFQVRAAPREDRREVHHRQLPDQLVPPVRVQVCTPLEEGHDDHHQRGEQRDSDAEREKHQQQGVVHWVDV